MGFGRGQTAGRMSRALLDLIHVLLPSLGNRIPTVGTEWGKKESKQAMSYFSHFCRYPSQVQIIILLLGEFQNVHFLLLMWDFAAGLTIWANAFYLQKMFQFLWKGFICGSWWDDQWRAVKTALEDDVQKRKENKTKINFFWKTLSEELSPLNLGWL